MRKLDFPLLIVESVDELRKREKLEQNARRRLRVQLLRLLKSQEVISIKEASRVCGITAKHGYDLWKKYRNEGLRQYVCLNWKPRRSKLSDEQQRRLLERASTDNGFGSQAEVRRYVADEFAVSYTQGGVSLLLNRLKIKAKVPRPRNRKAVAEEQAAYKKTLWGE